MAKVDFRSDANFVEEISLIAESICSISCSFDPQAAHLATVFQSTLSDNITTSPRSSVLLVCNLIATSRFLCAHMDRVESVVPDIIASKDVTYMKPTVQ